jgi:hypothetical protein
MLESSSGCIGLKCAWHGLFKQKTNKNYSEQFFYLDFMMMMLLLLHNQMIIFLLVLFFYLKKGLSDGISENRHHGLDSYLFAHTLISSCSEESDRIIGSPSMCSLVHRAIRCVVGFLCNES